MSIAFMARRKLTAADVEAQSNLRRVYGAYMATHKDATQESLAAAMGLTQGGLSGLLNGHFPLSIKAAIRMARVFGCDPRDLRPELRDLAFVGADSAKANESYNNLQRILPNDPAAQRFIIDALTAAYEKKQRTPRKRRPRKPDTGSDDDREAA